MPEIVPIWGRAASRARARLASRGLAEVATLAARRAREALWSDDRLIVLVRAATGAAPETPGVVLRRATAADAQRYARDIGTDSPATFRARLTGRTTCWLIDSHDQILHATWMTCDGAWTREVRRCLRPPEGDAYVYESFTRAEARGRGLYPLALAGISAHAGAEGVTRMWVAVENANLASLRAVTKAGFQAAFEIVYQRRLGRLAVEQLPRAEAGSAPRLELTARCPPAG